MIGDKELTDAEVALAAAEAGAAVVRRMYGADLRHLAKSPTDFATEADLEAEDAIRRVIAVARPEDAFEGEETGASAARPSAGGWSTRCAARSTSPPRRRSPRSTSRS